MARRAFSLLEILVSMSILAILVIVLASLNTHTLNIWHQVSGRAETFQAARGAMDSIVRTLELATLNPYWDYDNRSNPTRYVRMSNLAMVCGPASDLLGGDFGPGSLIVFQAPLGRTATESRSRLQLLLNTVGFFVEYRDVHSGAPTSLGLGPRRRSCLMQMQTEAGDMSAFNDTNPGSPDNSWFNDPALIDRASILADNILLLIVRPLRREGSGTLDLATTGFQLDSRAGETSSTQPATSNQLPPLVEVALVAASEASVRKKSEADGYRIPAELLDARFQIPTRLDQDLSDLAGDLRNVGLEVRTFRQTIVLPNSRWSD